MVTKVHGNIAQIPRTQGETPVKVYGPNGQPLNIDAAGDLHVDLNATKADDAAFTVGTDQVLPVGALVDDTTPDSADEGDVGIPRMGTDRVLYVQGQVAHDAADLGKPIKIGGKAETTAPAAVADGDRVDAWFDEYGRIVTVAQDVNGNPVGLTDQDTGAGTDLAQDVALMVPADGGGTQLGLIDDAVFTPGTSAVLPSGCLVDDTTPDSVDEGDIGVPRMSADRIPYVQGAIAHDAADSGNPIKIGGKAETTAPAAVADADRVDAWLDEYGRQVVVVKDTSGNIAALTDQDTAGGVDNARDVAIMVPASGGGAQLGLIDDAAFTPGTSAVVPIGATFDDTLPDAIDEGDIGTPRMGGDRVLYMQGAVAHDAADSGNPLKVGGKAETTAPAAVADADRVDAWFDEYGRQVVVLKDTSGNVVAATDQDSAGGADLARDVAIMVPASGGGAQLGVIDHAAFTPGTSAVLPIAAEFDDTSPNVVDEGDAGAVRMSSRRELYVQLRDAAGNERGLNVAADGSIAVDSELPAAAALADGASNPTTPTVGAATLLFNGTTFDRARGNISISVLTSAARTAETNSGDLVNYNHRSLLLIINVSAITATPVLTPKLAIKDSISANYFTIWTAAANIIATGTYAYLFALGGSGGAGTFTEAVNIIVGRTWRFTMSVADADEATYSVSADLLI